ncbi:MAG: hypothetical protein QXH42_09480 [Thermoplasmata archaeon]
MRIYESETCDARECLELGLALGSWMGQNAMVMTGTDGRPVSRLVRRALTVGLASLGVSVLDMRLVPEEVLRYEVRKQGMGAGIYVFFDGSKVGVSLYNSRGEPADPETVRRIMGLMAGEGREGGGGGRRTVGLMDLGTILYYPNGIEDYIESLYSEISFRNPLSVLADCQTTPLAALVPGLLERYGMKVQLFNGLVSGYGQPRPKEEFLEALRRERPHLGLRFVDVVEVYSASGEKLDERHGLKDLLLFLKDFRPPNSNAGVGR